MIRENGDYLLTIPTLPGCNAQGSTLEEAFEDLDVSLLEWTEEMIGRGHPIPKPDTPEDFAGTVVVRMPPRLHARLFSEAQRQGVSMNQLAVSMLAESLGGMGVLQRAEERLEILAREVRAAYGERP
ncbi:MAG: toxin-antitoxin system HicB family antitoxin [Coriobacteriia bacterium]|nr:toxin-antitoxin system HicB family antitoxin [Coriobacteriia bacterium]